MSDDNRTRTMRIDSVDDAGVFQMTLATEGEASDGDILSIAGGSIPERMPLLHSHRNDFTEKLGSVTNPVKLLKENPAVLRATGRIEFGGEEPQAAIRRDIAHMINEHGGSVSIRWTQADGGKRPMRRVDLPEDHPAYVDSKTETDERRRYGFFWPEWRALEGSVVALGADPAATIDGKMYRTRAAETEGDVSEFWRGLADACETPEEPDPEVEIDIEPEPRADEEPEPVPEEEPEERAEAEEEEELGADVPTGPDPLQEILARLESIEDRLSAREEVTEECEDPEAPLSSEENEREEEEGEPLAPTPQPTDIVQLVIDKLRETHPPEGPQVEPAVMRPREMAGYLRSELDAASKRVAANFRAEIDRVRGRVK